MSVFVRPRLVPLVLMSLVLKESKAFEQKPQTMYDVMKEAYKWNEAYDDKLDQQKRSLEGKLHEVFPWQKNCYTTEEKPRKPKPLSFCHKYNDMACCIPQLDDDNNIFFTQLTNLGLSCRIRGDIRDDPIAELYCLNCSPKQPRYVRVGVSMQNPLKRCEMLQTNITTTGVGSVTGSFADPSADGSMQTLLVSKEWAYALGTNPLLEGPDGRFNKCGLLVSVPCRGEDEDECGNAVTLNGRDRFMCGDDLVIPSNIDMYGILKKDDKGFLLEDESIEAFLNYEDLGTPLVNEGFHFKLVANKKCTNEMASSYLSPKCLRSSEQVRTLAITEVSQHGNHTYRDWVCSNLNGDFNASSASSADYCTNPNNLGLPNLSSCPDTRDPTTVFTTSARLSQYYELLLSSTVVQCCCGVWMDEEAFSHASLSSVPALSTIMMLTMMSVVCLMV